MLDRLVRRPAPDAETAASGVEALDMVEGETVDLIITDIRMPEVSGLQMLEAVARLGHCPSSVCSFPAMRNSNMRRKALRLGAFNYIAQAGGQGEMLIEAVEQALAARARPGADERMEKVVDPESAGAGAQRSRRSAKPINRSRADTSTTIWPNRSAWPRWPSCIHLNRELFQRAVQGTD